MNRSLTLCTLSLLAALGLAGCATSSPDVISRTHSQHLETVQSAVVESVRPVVVDGSQSGIGAIAGGIVGGVAGSGVGGHREHLAVGVLGAVAGGVLGNAIERAATREQAVELTLRLSDGRRQVLVQAEGGQQFYPGDRVDIIGSAGRYRVARAR